MFNRPGKANDLESSIYLDSSAGSEQKEGEKQKINPGIMAALPETAENNGIQNLAIHSEKVTYLDPNLSSFDNINEAEWGSKANGIGSIIDWAKDKNEDWLRKPNANSDEELVSAVNARQHPGGFVRKVKVGLNAVFTALPTLFIAPIRSTRNIKPGEIHFSDNAGLQEIHVTQGLNYVSGLRHSWKIKHNANKNYIKENNVTIARILPNEIGLAKENGNSIVLLPGRHAYNSAFFDYQNIAKPLIDTIINHGTITIIRVLPNELGRAKENGNPIILLPGLHIRNSASFEYVDKLNMRTLKGGVEHETISIVRVNKNEIGCALLKGEPVLLSPGIHIRNSTAFKFVKMENANNPHIDFQTIHVLQVKSDEIGLAWNDNKAITVPPGIYKLNSNTFTFKEIKKVSEKLINHAPITIVRVDQGELGYAWDNGKAIELEPGIHRREDPQFIFDRLEPANKEVIKHGNIAHIIVKDGEARAVYHQGKLNILDAGKYDYDDAQTLSIAEQAISLRDIIKPLKEIKVVTKDRMPMHVTGQVTYRVSDPIKLVKGIGQDKLDSSIEQITDSTLRHEISKTDLSMISPDHHSQQPEDKAEDKKDIRLLGDRSRALGEGDTTFRGKLCSAVQETIRQTTAMWGIEIVEFAISDIGYQDPTVEKKLADATAKIREAESNFDLQRTTNAVNYEQAKGKAAQKIIEENNSASVKDILTKATSSALLANAEAQAGADFLKAEREAKGKAAAMGIHAAGLKLQAECQRDADIARAQGQTALANASATTATAVLKAENEAKSLLLNNPNYVELEKARLFAEAAKPFANLQSPAIVINGSGNSEVASSMFLGQANFFRTLMSQRGLLIPAMNRSSVINEESKEEAERPNSPGK